MSSREIAFAAALLMATGALAQQAPKFGLPISEADIAAWNIEISPDGAGLPEGAGTVAEGEKVFSAKCQMCHGEKGGGRPNDVLVGGFDTIAAPDKPAVKTVGSYWPYATTLFDYVRRAMPWQAPKTLTDNEVYAVAAYLLNLNKIIGEGEVMNARTLPKVVMPNRDGFIDFPRPAK
jgi:cytochrome c